MSEDRNTEETLIALLFSANSTLSDLLVLSKNEKQFNFFKFFYCKIILDGTFSDRKMFTSYAECAEKLKNMDIKEMESNA